MIKKIAIYDMDGTIIDSSHRYRTDKTGERIDLQHWRDNQHLAGEDGFLPLVRQYHDDLLNPEIFVVIATAREMDIHTHLYVIEKLGRPDHFIGRPASSRIKGSRLKIQGIENLIAKMPCLSGLPMVVYEDNKQYLSDIGVRFNAKQVYIPSIQGH